MTSHATIITNAANAVYNSAEVKDYCVTHFGKGCLVVVDAYAPLGFPGEEEAPFVFVGRADAEAERGNVDAETFDFQAVAGISAAGSGDLAAESRLVPRTATANGKHVAGDMAKAEGLRDLAVAAIRATGIGAAVGSIRLDESTALDYPLQWARATISVYSPNNLGD